MIEMENYKNRCHDLLDGAAPMPVISFLISCSSMCWILIRTNRK